MIFDSLGLGELGVIAVLVILLVEPKQLGRILKAFGKFKRKVSQIQNDVKTQLNAIADLEEAKEARQVEHDTGLLPEEQQAPPGEGQVPWGRVRTRLTVVTHRQRPVSTDDPRLVWATPYLSALAEENVGYLHTHRSGTSPAASVATTAKPICSDAMPPHAMMKSPASSSFNSAGAGE
mgnify:CR=1 FL=1